MKFIVYYLWKRITKILSLLPAVGDGLSSIVESFGKSIIEMEFKERARKYLIYFSVNDLEELAAKSFIENLNFIKKVIEVIKENSDIKNSKWEEVKKYLSSEYIDNEIYGSKFLNNYSKIGNEMSEKTIEVLLKEYKDSYDKENEYGERKKKLITTITKILGDVCMEMYSELKIKLEERKKDISDNSENTTCSCTCYIF